MDQFHLYQAMCLCMHPITWIYYYLQSTFSTSLVIFILKVRRQAELKYNFYPLSPEESDLVAIPKGRLKAIQEGRFQGLIILCLILLFPFALGKQN